MDEVLMEEELGVDEVVVDEEEGMDLEVETRVLELVEIKLPSDSVLALILTLGRNVPVVLVEIKVQDVELLVPEVEVSIFQLIVVFLVLLLLVP
ncbi:uncharacterized protein PV07_02750 [Cladophialophora immunda]|uniref:Uncharacterized protein n=1 Tax=Cladophialophora immunda TaxID=569365 RepID=A0A0D2B0I6_9EURO|nr:uncharacterized protein PV07_02750 [Cladophialophora immunda]KIW31067.1 hypothetical protein PV07_02750 [Cladophialophora immunda]